MVDKFYCWLATLVVGSGRPGPSSEELHDDMNRAVSANLSRADGKDTIEERVSRRGGLETRHRPEIVVRVDAHAGERHLNQVAVVGLERDPQIEREGSVLVRCNPVAAAGEHLAAKARAFERAAGDREDRERALRRRANFLDR